jgi:uncharacterized protein (TIGR03437 family)
MRPFIRSVISSFSFVLLLTASAALTWAQAPQIMPNGLVNAASGNGPIAPGSLLSIYGTNLSPVTDIDTAIPLPPTMDGVTVSVNNIQAPLWFVSSGQINAQIPFEALPSAPPTSNSATVQVVVSTKSGGASAPASLTLSPTGPGIFTFYYGAGQAIAYNYADGSFASATPIQGYTTVPYRAVKINDPNPLVIYATGLGAVTPAVDTGAAPPTGTIAYTVSPPTVLIGGVQAQVLFSGLSQFPGVYQLNVTVPAGTPTGSAVPLQIQMNGFTSRGDVTIAVSQ